MAERWWCTNTKNPSAASAIASARPMRMPAPVTSAPFMGTPIRQQPHPEEPRAARRLEGWAANAVLVPSLRDAALRAAPQGEVLLASSRVHLLACAHDFVPA